MNTGRMTWEEMKNLYPDRWIAISDYKKEGSRILEGIPAGVCEENEMKDNNGRIVIDNHFEHSIQ